MSRAGICLIKHMGKSSPIEAYRADMADDVAERVAGGEEVDAAWLAVIDDKLADLSTEAARIEQVVADAYAARPAKTAAQVDATHKDPGQPAEPVTQEVVAQAISKAAKREEIPRSQMKAEALRLIDAAIASAPTQREADKGNPAPKKTTINVPGDGVFTVVNTVENLKEFRRQVELSPGFRDKLPTFPIGKASSSPSYGPDQLAREMLEDGEPVNALAVLESAGKTMMFGNGNGKPIPYTNAEQVEIEGITGLFVGRGFGTKKGSTSWWSVVHMGSGFAIGGSHTSKADAIAEAKKALAQPEKLEKMRSLIAQGKSADGMPFIPQEELRAQFLASAEATQEATFNANDASIARAADMKRREAGRDAFYASVMGPEAKRPGWSPQHQWGQENVSAFLKAAEKSGKVTEALAFIRDVLPESNQFLNDTVDKWAKAHERRTKPDDTGWQTGFQAPGGYRRIRRDVKDIDGTTYRAELDEFAGAYVTGTIQQWSDGDGRPRTVATYSNDRDARYKAEKFLDSVVEKRKPTRAAPAAEPAKINDAGEKTRTDDTGNVALFSVFTPTFTVDANPDAAQTPADGQVSPDDRRAVELLQAGLRKQRPELVLNAVSSGSGAPGSQLSGRDDRARQAAADVAARLFGKRLTFFTSNVPLAAGAYSTKQPDRIFLARDNAHPIMAVTGHEILHAMRKDRPDLYDALLAAIRKNSADVDQAGLLLRLKYKKLNLTTPTPEVQEEEFLADVVGDRWTEPEFWALMSQGQPQGMRRVLAAIVSWLDALVDKIPNTRPFNTAVYLTDIKAARKAVAEAMRNYSAGEVGTVPDDGEVRFSLADQTDTPAFRRWFGDSKVVDAQGKPLVVYHGTKAEFTEFKRTKSGEFGPAIYLTDSAREAGEYGDGKGWGGPSGTAVMPVYVSIKNPYTNGVDAFWKEFGGADSDAAALDRAQAAGYDGIIAKREDRYYDNAAREFVDRGETLTHYIAFRPEQIKSAIGNSGAFDPKNADIRYSRAAGAGITMNDAEAVAATVRAMFPSAPPIIVHDNVSEVRPEVQDMIRAKRAFNDVEAMFHEGEIHVFASHLKDIDRALFVVGRHEIRHAGMAAMFGSKPAKRQALLGIALKNRDLMDEAMARVSSGRETDRIVAIEEVLADMPVSRLMALDGIDRLIARIRQWLRDAAAALRKKGYASLANAVDPSEWTDNDVAAFVLRAENVSRAGGGMQPASGGTMFSRAQQDKQERTAEKAAAAESPTPRDIAKSATQRIGELLNDPGTLTRWDNSLGTPYNLAQRFPAFKRVFEAMQDHAADISDFANSAADKAKTILPRLDRARDVFKGPLAAADAKAVQRPIFDGTLLWTRDAKNKPVLVADVEAEAADMSVFDKSERQLRERHIDPRVLKMWQGMPLETFTQIIEGKYKSQYLRPGIVWKPSELKAMFGLNDKQVGIYREFRAATDASLDRLAITTMIRAAMDPSLRSRVEGMSPSEAAEVIRPLAEEAARRDALAAGKTESAADKAAEAAGNKITETADRVEQLQAEGYAPLMRFGTRYVDVIVDGQRAYFGMYEGAIERSRDVARLRAMFPGAELRLGTVSTEDYKLFEGVSPETLALFADVVGLTDEQDKNAMFQEYLRNAVNNRSAMKRLIQRKAIQGFTEDVPRVLAGFITSNARASANNLNTKGIVEAIDAIDPRDARTGQGELKDYAVQLREFMQQPGEQAAALRGMMFHWYLGGNISSALVNMTQAFQTTLPELSKLVGASKATKLVTQAMGTIWKKRDGALGDALKRAENEGHVSPQELYHLDAMARGAGHLRSGESTTDKALAIGSNSITRLAFLWGRPFALAEQFNRRVTFIAAFQAAESKGLADPYAYAVDLIDASQFVYGMHNRPVWGRSFAGATLLTFKTFTISMLEAMYRNAKTPQGRKALVLMLLALFVLAGLEGLPFREDVEDVIDAIMQRLMDRNFHSREARDKAIKRLFNALMTDEYAEVASRFVQKGLSGVPGAPIDVAGRFSMANIIPGTGALTVKQDRFGDATELLGPVGGLVKQAGDAGGLLSEGRIVEGIKAALPTAGRNIAQGIQMATTGEYRDGRGNMVVKTDNVDAGFKAAGFQPNAVAAPRSAERLQQRRGDVARIKEAEMVNAFARAVRDEDSDAMTAAAAQYAAWNVNNPESRITITPAQVEARVKAMQSTSEERIIKRTPKEMRSSVVEGLAGAR